MMGQSASKKITQVFTDAWDFHDWKEFNTINKSLYIESLDIHILPFLCPLRNDHHFPKSVTPWSCNHLSDYCIKNGHNIVAMVDLIEENRRKTNFYSQNDLDESFSRPIQHLRVPMRSGHVPSEEECGAFIKTIRDLASENPGSTIGVHCKHGINRTGYVVCRLLMELDTPVPESYPYFHVYFEHTRGHRITRKHFVQDLVLRESNKS